MEVLGTLDELNASIGVLVAELRESGEAYPELERIQSRLFDVGAELAADADDKRFQVEGFEVHIAALERGIDQMEESLTELKAFILPGGTRVAAQCHLARTVCRRAERKVIQLAEIREVRADLLAWLNRLSDWLFVFARKLNSDAGVADTVWKKP